MRTHWVYHSNNNCTPSALKQQTSGAAAQGKIDELDLVIWASTMDDWAQDCDPDFNAGQNTFSSWLETAVRCQNYYLMICVSQVQTHCKVEGCIRDILWNVILRRLILFSIHAPWLLRTTIATCTCRVPICLYPKCQSSSIRHSQ